MVNRPAGGARSAKHLRAPLDWYIEEAQPVEQLLHAIDFGDDPIWDGCCGRGNILEVASRYGHRVAGSDLTDRRKEYRDFTFRVDDWRKQDILETQTNPWGFGSFGPHWSYISNPPYNYSEGIAERIIRHVVSTLKPRRAAFLLPIAFMASTGRYRLFTRDLRPSHTGVLSERITCPPGEMVVDLDRFHSGQMTRLQFEERWPNFKPESGKAFDGGMADYVWMVWTRPHNWRTETVWLEPGPHPYPPRRATQGEANAA